MPTVPAKIFTTENTERTEKDHGKTKHNIFLKIERDFSFSIFLCVLCALCGDNFLKMSE